MTPEELAEIYPGLAVDEYPTVIVWGPDMLRNPDLIQIDIKQFGRPTYTSSFLLDRAGAEQLVVQLNRFLNEVKEE